MAMTHATIQGSTRTVQVISSSQVNDVMEIAATSIPHGVFFQKVVPYAAWLDQTYEFVVDGIGEFIEGAFAEPYVVGAAYIQDVNPTTGLLDDALDFTLQVPTPAGKMGPFQATQRIFYNVLPFGIDYNSIFAATLTALNATANA